MRLSRRNFLSLTAASTTAMLTGCRNIPYSNEGDDKVNFLFVLTDDQRYDALGFMKTPEYLQTPNMDRLKAEGAFLENAFCTTSLCSPSRASFLTGTYAHRHGIMANAMGNDFDFNKTPSFTQLLQEKADYKTAFLGKWHMGGLTDEPRLGFDYWLSFKDQGVYEDPVLNENGKRFKQQGYITDILNGKAVQWLEENGSEPFCMYLSHKAVHGPFKPAPRHEGRYEDAEEDKPRFKDTLAGKPYWQRALVKEWVKKGYRSRDYRQKNCIRDIPESYDKTDKFEYPEFRKDYYECLLAVDEGLGKIVEKLREIGELDNTVIVFAGDNGFFMGEHRMTDKRNAYEESIRIPMLIRYPKMVPAGSIIEQQVLNIDLAPTFLDLAGVEIPEHMQGLSMRRLFTQGGKKRWRKSILYEYWVDINYPQYPRITAVRTDDFKLITYPDIDDKDELYDLKNDPGEKKNLIDVPFYAQKKEELLSELDRLLKETEYKSSYGYLDKSKPFGLMFKTDFEKSKGNVLIDEKGSNGTIKNAEIKKVNDKASLVLNHNSSVLIPQNPKLDITDAPFILDIKFTADSDGTIISQGKGYSGSWGLFVENGIPCFIVRDERRYAVADGIKDCIGKETHLAASIGMHRCELYINGEKAADVPRGRYLRFVESYDVVIGKGFLVNDCIKPDEWMERYNIDIGETESHSINGEIHSLAFYREDNIEEFL